MITKELYHAMAGPGVYILMDGDGVLYVGSSSCVWARLTNSQSRMMPVPVAERRRMTAFAEMTHLDVEYFPTILAASKFAKRS